MICILIFVALFNASASSQSSNLGPFDVTIFNSSCRQYLLGSDHWIDSATYYRELSFDHPFRIKSKSERAFLVFESAQRPRQRRLSIKNAANDRIPLLLVTLESSDGLRPQSSVYGFMTEQDLNDSAYLQNIVEHFEYTEFGSVRAQEFQTLQYQWVDPVSHHSWPFWSLPGVYRGATTYGDALITAAHQQNIRPHHRALILGAGDGHDAVFLAHAKIADWTATDIDPLSISNVRMNLHAYGIENVSVIQSDLFSGLDVAAKFDYILFNAPRPLKLRFLDSDFHRLGLGDLRDSFRFSSYDRGYVDLYGLLLRRLLRELPSRLTVGGKLLLMTDTQVHSMLPTGLKATQISPSQPWSDQEQARFAIFAIELT